MHARNISRPNSIPLHRGYNDTSTHTTDTTTSTMLGSVSTSKKNLVTQEKNKKGRTRDRKWPLSHVSEEPIQCEKRC
jgi:hypothetical protein